MAESLSLISYSAPPPELKLGAPLHQRTYLAGGELREWTGQVQEVFSPLADELGKLPAIGSYPRLGSTESLHALDAATKAYNMGRGGWPTMPLARRIEHLGAFARAMREQKEAIVRLLVWEIGKTYIDSGKEFDRTVQYIHDTIDAAKHLDRASSRFSVSEEIIAQIRRAPLGVVLCMGPFNYPLNETFTTLIPALLMGNAVIFKPPKLGVLLHEPLLELFRKHFPAGVVNTVYGDGSQVVTPLMESGRIDALAFIGTSRVAKILKSKHPQLHRLRSVLGLEAKNPGIILPDADIENAVRECILGCFSFNGQRCTALKILFVHEQIRERFLAQFVRAVDDLKIGYPWQAGVSITPLADQSAVTRLRAITEDAVARGSKILNKHGGQVQHTFLFPTLLSPVSPESRIYNEEQFGPIVPIVPFDSLDMPLSYISNSPFGQQVSIFGRNSSALGALIDPLVNQVCRVNLNCQCQRGPDSLPFTGRKDSAEGTLSVSDALRVFSIRTLVAAKAGELNKTLLQEIVQERKSAFLSTDFIF